MKRESIIAIRKGTVETRQGHLYCAKDMKRVKQYDSDIMVYFNNDNIPVRLGASSIAEAKEVTTILRHHIEKGGE